jgi:hypothetical protein
MMDVFNLEDRYKYEVQIDQRGKDFNGVTYSYKSTVFYGKAGSKGTINPKTGKVILQETKLLELKMTPNSYACWMICFLQYNKNGDEEFLEGKYSSYRDTDSSFCGKGTVFLRRVVTSDFYKEPFLAKREKEKKAAQQLLVEKKVAPAIGKDSAKPKPLLAINKPAPKTTAPARKEQPKAVPRKSEPIVKESKKDMKAASPILGIDTSKKYQINRPKEPTIIPAVLRNRSNEVVQTLVLNANEITIDVYDNGTIDHDTISVYLDKKLIVAHQMLKATPITFKINMDDTNNYHELVMVADNLGDIPPNTSLMVVKAGDKQYEVRIASTEQQNAVVIFKFEKPK